MALVSKQCSLKNRMIHLTDTTIHIIAQSKWNLLSTYIDFNKQNDKKDPKFEVSNHVRTSKWKKYLKGYAPNWSAELSVIKK